MSCARVCAYNGRYTCCAECVREKTEITDKKKEKNQNLRRHFFPAPCHRRIVSPGRPSPPRRGLCLIGVYTTRACVYEAPTGSLSCPSSVFVASIRYTVVFSRWLSITIYHFIGYTCNASNIREHCFLSFNTLHLFPRDTRANVIIFIAITKVKRGRIFLEIIK